MPLVLGTLSPLPGSALPICSSWVNNLRDRFPGGKSACQAGRQMPEFQSERKKTAYKVIWLNSKKCVFETFF